MTVTEERRHRTLDLAHGRDEMNFSEWPLGGLSNRQPSGITKLVFTDRIPHPKTREPVDRGFTIAPSAEYGFPTALDDEVILGLVQLSKLNDFASPDVSFSRYELVKVLGWSDQGWSYRRLDESVRRWMGVTLYYENAWWDVEQEDWVSEYFHIIDNAKLHQRKRSPISITWNSVVYRSFKADNLKRLDLTFYFSLDHAGSKRAFRYLDKKLYRRKRWEFPLREFACDHIGLSTTYDTGKLKAKLQPFIEELEAKGFLEPLSRRERYVKIRPGAWNVVVIAKRRSKELTQTPNPLHDELTRRGVTPAVAGDLVNDYAAERILHKIELFDFLAGSRRHETPRSPGGWLTKAIKDDFTPPADFKTKAQRADDAQRKRERELAERREQQQEQRQSDREKAERQKLFDTWQPVWEALADTEQRDVWNTIWRGNNFFSFANSRHRQSLTALEPCLQELARRHTDKLSKS